MRIVTKKMTDEHGQKWVLFYEQGKLLQPVFIMTEYETKMMVANMEIFSSDIKADLQIIRSHVENINSAVPAKSVKALEEFVRQPKNSAMTLLDTLIDALE